MRKYIETPKSPKGDLTGRESFDIKSIYQLAKELMVEVCRKEKSPLGDLGLILLLLLSASCTPEETKTESNHKDQEAELPVTIQGELFKFSETKDPQFCEADSIVGSDCAGGYIYLTAKGNVIYSFECMGSDSTHYSIGTYKEDSTRIVLTFNRNYSFYAGEEDETENTKPVNPNSGRGWPTKEWQLKMVKLNCPSFQYGLHSGDALFAVEKETDISDHLFLETLKKIDTLKGL